ncbi:MAG: heparinase II/III family protein, partial [Armatimonadota bacterium]
MDPGSRYQPTFGDGGLTRAFAKTNLLLALRGNEDAAWYLQQIDYLKPADVERFIAVKPGAILPTEPTWNPSSCFVDVGYASLRDGHNADSPFLAFKCGPPDLAVGHNHFDHNSFQIAFDGTWLATDPGYRSYFQPRERKYTTASFGHNTIALDVTSEFLADTKCPAVGHGQVRVNKGRIVRHFSSPGFDYVAGSAAETYNTDDRQVLEKFERQVLFVKPNLFITRDVLAAPEAHSFHYMLHTDATGLIEVAGANEARLRRGRDLLEAHIFSPAGLTLTTAIYPGAESRGPYLNAATPVGKAVVITAALVPRVSPPALVNPGFESGMIGWTPRRMPGFTENHVIDDEVAHSGARSARIDGP